MSDCKSITPKATVTLRNLDTVAGAYTSTVQLNRGKFTNKLTFSDKTFQPLSLDDVKALKDVTFSSDIKLDSKWTANTKVDLATKKYTLGATWSGELGGKATTLKGTYVPDGLLAGEATVSLDKSIKGNVTFNQQQLLTSKLTYVKGKFTVEPSYNIAKKAPAISVTAKVGSSGDSLKIAYDIKSEATAIEYSHKPFKVVAGTTLGKHNGVSKPTVSVVFENTYDL